MAVLLHEGDYALRQENSKKIVFQLKLTDSSLRTLESLEGNSAPGHRLKPSIRFNGSQGVIQIPSKEQNEKQAFTFQMSSLSHSCAIDCLQQHDSWNCVGLVSVLGAIKQKLTIHANDDSYNVTKRRMERVKEQEKNVSTKVIKQPSSSKLPGKKKLLGRQFLEPSNSNTALGKPAPSFPRSISPHPPAPDLAGMRNKTKPILSSLPSSKPPSTLISGKQLHEKVLHYLAIRPMRLHDLITRLSRGQTHVDKSKVQSLLTQMATSRHISANTLEYSLNKHLFSTVNPEWPGYDDNERPTVRRNVETYKNSDSRKRTFLTPQPSPKNSPSPQAALQEDSYSNPLKKKARVSLYNKNSPNNSRPPSTPPFATSQPLSSGSTSSAAMLSSSSVVDLDKLGVNELLPPARSKSTVPPKSHSDQKSKPSNDIPAAKQHAKETSSVTVSHERKTKDTLTRQKQPADRKPLPPHSSHISPGSDDVRSDDTTIPSPEDANTISTYNDDEFLRKYQPISFPEERDQYKSDFHAEYKEYLTLHQRLLYQSKRFSDWEVELKKHEKYTEPYQRLAQTVYDEYRRLKEETGYLKHRERFSYLYRKLKHIKSLVLEYDQKQFVSRKRGDMPSLTEPKRTAKISRSKPGFL